MIAATEEENNGHFTSHRQSVPAPAIEDLPISNQTLHEIGKKIDLGVNLTAEELAL